MSYINTNKQTNRYSVVFSANIILKKENPVPYQFFKNDNTHTLVDLVDPAPTIFTAVLENSYMYT